MYSCTDGRLPVPTRPFSFPSSLRQLRDLRRSRSWDRLCGEGASTRSWNRPSGCEPAEHHGRDGYRGGSWNVCALDVGALIFLLILHIVGTDGPPRGCLATVRPYVIYGSSGQIIAAGRRSVK